MDWNAFRLTSYTRQLGKKETIIKRLWHTRSVGLKLRGFDTDPNLLAESLPVRTEYHCKGEPHGTHNTFKENQIFIAKIFEQDHFFDDVLLILVDELGGVSRTKKMIQRVKPKSTGFVVNLPASDIYPGLGSGISKECAKLLIEFDSNFGINYF